MEIWGSNPDRGLTFLLLQNGQTGSDYNLNFNFILNHFRYNVCLYLCVCVCIYIYIIYSYIFYCFVKLLALTFSVFGLYYLYL
jgi:hypothetical protein